MQICCLKKFLLSAAEFFDGFPVLKVTLLSRYFFTVVLSSFYAEMLNSHLEFRCESFDK